MDTDLMQGKIKQMPVTAMHGKWLVIYLHKVFFRSAVGKVPSQIDINAKTTGLNDVSSVEVNIRLCGNATQRQRQQQRRPATRSRRESIAQRPMRAERPSAFDGNECAPIRLKSPEVENARTEKLAKIFLCQIFRSR